MGVVARPRAEEPASPFPDVKPFPVAAGSQPGHNRPPLDVEARAAFDDVLDQRDGFRQRMTDLIAASDRATATDDETAGRCGELVKQIRAATKVVEDAHKTTKEPYLAAGRAVDAAKNELVTPLDAAKRKVEAKQTQYLREQEAIRQAELRRQREAEEARRREEAEREAAARAARGEDEAAVAVAEASFSPPPAPEPERQIIRGDMGAAVSAKREWYAQVEDYEIAFMAVSNNSKVREAIDTAVKAMVRAGVREIAGVRIWDDVKASNR